MPEKCRIITDTVMAHIEPRKPGRKGILDDPAKRAQLISLLNDHSKTIEEIAAEMNRSKSSIEKVANILRREAKEAA